MASDVDTRKSTSGYMMTFTRRPVSWQSKLQKCIALSSIEAEYITATDAVKELLWIEKFLQELGLNQKTFILYCDSKSVIHLSKNSAFHSRSKYIDVRYHWIRDALEMKIFLLEKIHTDDNGSDMMTKALTSEKLMFYSEQAGLFSCPT